MKIFLNILLAAIMASCLCACKDNVVTPPASGGLYIANVVANAPALAFNDTKQTVSNNNFTLFSVAAGQLPVKLSTSTTPAVSYYNQVLSFNDKDNYTLFLSGASATAVDATLVKESYTNYTDSVCAVRFINLSPNSSPISVNITGQANGSEVTSLAYKAYTGFKPYPAKLINTSYAFQFRDATTGALITSYSFPVRKFLNATIIFRGLVGGSPAPGITLINYN